MDLKIYTQQKAAGIAKIVKVGPQTAAYLSPRFDPQTGVALPAEVNQFNLQTLDDAIAEQTASLKALTDLRADVAAVINAP